MAGAGYKLFNTGDVLTAAQVNTYLMEQTVMVFADAAARTAALSGVVSEGMISYLKDTNAVEVYNGSAWVASDDPNAIQNTIVDAKGDLITATANDTPARLAVGTNGDTLLADGASSVGLRYQEPKAGNPVINSSFQVWQRGTSVSIAASQTGVYSADRWTTSTGANQAITISRQATGDTTNLPNIQYCARYQRNSGQTGTGVLNFYNNFESINSIPFAGKTVVVSFYARKGADYSAASSTLTCNVQTGTGTDQNVLVSGYTGGAVSGSVAATLTTTWQRFTTTAFTVPAASTEIAMGFAFTPVGTASTNDYYEVTGVQLEVGSVATPFKTQGVTLAGELAACQRYYFRDADILGHFALGFATSSTASRYIVRLPVSMRVEPTSVEAGAGLNVGDLSSYNMALTAITLGDSTPSTVRLNVTVASGQTAYRPQAIFGVAGNSTDYLAFSAEL